MTTSKVTTTIPTAFLECQLFAYQNGLAAPWNTFSDAAMNKIAGTSKASVVSKNAERRPGAGIKEPSKAAQTILAALTAEGLPKRAIVTATGLTPKQVATAIPTMEKSGIAHMKNSRLFAGPAPAKAVGRVTRGAPKRLGRPRKESAAESTGTISLSDATIRAVQSAGQQGVGSATIRDYLISVFGLTARPNHIGIALERHRKAARLIKHNELWYPPNVTEFRQAG